MGCEAALAGQWMRVLVSCSHTCCIIDVNQSPECDHAPSPHGRTPAAQHCCTILQGCLAALGREGTFQAAPNLPLRSTFNSSPPTPTVCDRQSTHTLHHSLESDTCTVITRYARIFTSATFACVVI